MSGQVGRWSGALLPAIVLLCLVLPFLFKGCGSEPQGPLTPRQKHAQAMRKAVDYFWSAQDGDGGWHSQDYGLLRSGQSLTPLVLWTLLQMPDDLVKRNDPRLMKAAIFLRSKMNRAGCVGMKDPSIPDYPNYASGLALRALVQLGGQNDAVRRLQAYLLGQQFQPSLGWKPGDPAFGGWGMGGAPRRAGRDPGHMDLSMTRVVLQGLAAFPPKDPEVFMRAGGFLARCQNKDGSFYFSPVVLGANKGPRDGEDFGGYGSTTADGILSMLAIGMKPDADRVRNARDWLVSHHRTDRVPGIPAETPARWATSLRFYYLAVSSQVFARLQVKEAPAGRDWRKGAVDALLPLQREDGSWSNPEGQVKEDDPIIATSLALIALARAY